MRVPIIVAVCLSAAGIAWLIAQDGKVIATAQQAEILPEIYRTADPAVARTFQGMPTDLADLPTTPIAPWDDLAVRGWMAETLKTLEAEIDDPETLRLAPCAGGRGYHAECD